MSVFVLDPPRHPGDPSEPAQLTCRPAPACDPPYDRLGTTEAASTAGPDAAALAVALPGLDLTLWPPSGQHSPDAAGLVGRAEPAARRSARAASTGSTASTSAPGPRAIVIVRALLEVLAGVRSPAQLNGWVTPALALDLDQRRRAGRATRPPTLLSVRLSEPRPGVAEVSAVVRRPGPEGRSGALALRMDLRTDRWVVSRLAVG